MVSTRSKDNSKQPDAGNKRAAPASVSSKGSKKQKTETNAKLEVGDDGEVGLKKEDKNNNDAEQEDKDEGKSEGKDGNEAETKAGEAMEMTREEMKAKEGEKAEKGEDEVDQKALQGIKGELEEPKHGMSVLYNTFKDCE